MDGSQSLPLLSDGEEEQSTVDDAKEPQPSSSTGGWSAAIYILCVEVAERFAYFGLASNLIIYLTNVLHESTVPAVKKLNIWAGVGSMLPLVGAFVADTYLGRYHTILFSSLITLLGVATLTLSATSLIPSQFQESLLFIALYVLAIGQGGHRPCAQPFGADQFNQETTQEKEALTSFFNWWYFGISWGSVSGIILVSYVQENVMWAIGFGIPFIAMVIAFIVYLLGRKLYKRKPPRGSPLTLVAQVLVAAARKRHLPARKGDQEEGGQASLFGPLDCRNQFKFLDKASIKDELDEVYKSRNSWRLCSTAQVEDVKLLLRLLPIWCSCLVYAVVFAQAPTFFTKQCSTLDRRIWSSFEVPAATFQLLVALGAIITIPIYNWILVPVLRKITKIPSGLTVLQKIGVGIFLSVIYMAIAALVESRRLRIAAKQSLFNMTETTIPMSVWWLLPQDLICGISDVLALTGLQELFYSEVPDSMKSLGSAALLSVIGIGNFLSSFILSFLQAIHSEWVPEDLNSGHMDYYYWLLAGLSITFLVLYVGVARRFVYKPVRGA